MKHILLQITSPKTTKTTTFQMNNNRTIYAVVIQQFSIECRKRSKTKVINLANHKGHRRSSEPIRVCGNYLYLVEARENECECATIGLGFTSDWMNNWREFFKPIVWRNWCKTNHFLSLSENRSISYSAKKVAGCHGIILHLCISLYYSKHKIVPTQRH